MAKVPSFHSVGICPCEGLMHPSPGAVPQLAEAGSCSSVQYVPAAVQEQYQHQAGSLVAGLVLWDLPVTVPCPRGWLYPWQRA